jgi:hypothetical protein
MKQAVKSYKHIIDPVKFSGTLNVPIKHQLRYNGEMEEDEDEETFIFRLGIEKDNTNIEFEHTDPKSVTITNNKSVLVFDSIRKVYYIPKEEKVVLENFYGNKVCLVEILINGNIRIYTGFDKKKYNPQWK